jgi:hypothetical protein
MDGITKAKANYHRNDENNDPQDSSAVCLHCLVAFFSLQVPHLQVAQESESARNVVRSDGSITTYYIPQVIGNI